MIKIVCMKWGTKFSADYVNVLYAATRRQMHRPFEFQCFTDDPAGLAAGIVARPLPDLGLPDSRKANGGWPKLGMFQRGLFDPDDLVMVLDLDLMVVGSLDAFFDRAEATGGLHILREWVPALGWMLPRWLQPDRGPQSSIFIFRPRDQYHLLESFLADPDASYRNARNEQKFIGQFADRPHYLPDDWTVSFKRHCMSSNPFNALSGRVVRRPPDVKVVVFHGLPRPDDLVRDDNSRWGKGIKFGYGPVDWVKSYWQQGLREAAAASRP